MSLDDMTRDKMHQLFVKEKVSSEQIRILHNNLMTALPGNFIGALAVFISLLQNHPSNYLLDWFIGVVIVSLLRGAEYYLYRHSPANDKLFLTLFMVGVCMSATLWALIATMLMPTGDVLAQMVCIVVITGISASGLQTLTPILKAAILHLTMLVGPLCIWVLLQGGLPYIMLGICIVAYFGFMLMVAVRGHRSLTTMLNLRYENQALLEKISVSNSKLIDYSKNLYQQSIHDSLTGLFNRRYLDETLPRELQRVMREQQSLCIAMLDLDLFKTFNDTHGHAAGDAVLKFVATLLQDTFRESDISCRFGGEEFLVVLINTDIASAKMRLERFREMVKKGKVSFQGQVLPPMTVSIGVAEAPRQGTTVDEIIRVADQALYVAKHAGRDRTESAVASLL
jgi:diguanylate cyclase (GGDEF)-like protein